MNTVFEITPRWNTSARYIFNGIILPVGMWVFDDKSRKIKHEPFVGDTNIIINDMVKDIPNSTDGFKLMFSDKPFDGCNEYSLIRGEEKLGGCYYTLRLSYNYVGRGWLCKVLYKYFPIAPYNIWFKVSAL